MLKKNNWKTSLSIWSTLLNTRNKDHCMVTSTNLFND